MQRQGHLAPDGTPEARRPEPAPARTRAVPGAPNRRTSPRQFMHEVNVELRKVKWPSREELTNYATVVLLALVVLTGLIFLLDLGFNDAANFLFK